LFRPVAWRLLAVLLFSLALPAHATTYYVDAGAGSNTYNGLYSAFSGGTNGPKLNIGSAITAASSGDVISVASGFYGLETNWDLSTKALTLLPQGQVIVYQSDPWLTFSIGDGISDGWRQYYFGSSTTTNYLSCATCDPNDNGVSNYGEFTNGTDPIVMAATAVIPTNRLIDWTQAGMGPGGIPTVTTTSTVISAGANAGTIQTALDNAASNSVVILSTGSYTINAELKIRHNGVVLRGADPSGTGVVFNGASPLADSSNPDIMLNIGEQDIIFPSVVTDACGYSTTPYSNNWIAGFSVGMTNIYVAANATTQNLAAGMIIGLDEHDDGTNLVPGIGDTDASYARECNRRSLSEYKVITSVVTNQITFYPGLISPYWNASLDPAIFWPDTNAADYVSLCGVENITFNGNNLPKYVVNIGPSFHCWIKNCFINNVHSGTSGESQLGASFAVNFEVRHSTLTPGPTPSSYGNYDFSPHNCSGYRFEDNIFNGYYNPILHYECSGYVEAFNYFTNDLDQATDGNEGCYCAGPTANFAAHGGQVFFGLVEGNYARYHEYYNNNGYETYGVTFRNRLTGYEKPTDTNASSSFRPIRLMENSWYESIVGNILGTSNYTTPYEGASGGDAVYCTAGTNGDFISGGPADVDFSDPKVTNTLFRAGNWDAVNEAVVWGTIAMQPITNSLAYSGRPAWYPASLTWPPFDPNGPTLTPTNLPAFYRFLHNGADAP